MMKKLFPLFLIAILMIGSCGLVSAAANDALNGFGVVPESCQSDSDRAVTRAEFAYTIAKIYGSGEIKAVATEYTDVDEKNIYSGYINHVTGMGFLPAEDSKFGPNDALSFNDFNASVIKILAYETVALANGGGDAGNLKTVQDLGLYKGVEIPTLDTMTVSQYRTLIYNLLTSKIKDFDYIYDAEGNVNLKVSGTTKTLLSDYLAISRYYGTITSVHKSPYRAEVLIEKIHAANKNAVFSEGTTQMLYAEGTMDLNNYENVPAEIWVDSNDKIVYIAPDKNVKVFYDVIYSVNNDLDGNNAYSARYIDEIEFNGNTEVYEVNDACRVKYNGTETFGAVKLAGRFAKVVTVDEVVSYMEVYDLEEAGLVTEVTAGGITYIKGENGGKIKNITEYEKAIVIVDGLSTDSAHVKPGSIVSYYKKDDKSLMVVVASEKAIVGKFSGRGNGEIMVGKYTYEADNDVYYSKDGKTYKLDDYTDILHTNVIAYVDAYGYVKYVKADGEAKESNKFIGYLVSKGTLGFDDIQLKLWKISPKVEEAVYTVSQKVIYEDGLREASLTPITIANCGNASSYLYEFEIDSKGEIKRISKPDFWKMYGNSAEASIGTMGYFENESTPSAYVDYDGFNGKMYFYGTRYIGLAKQDGKIVPIEKTWSEVFAKEHYANQTANAKFNFALLADPEASSPEIMVLFGETEKIRGYNQKANGTIEKLTAVYDEKTGEVYYNMVLENGAGTFKLKNIECDITNNGVTARGELASGMRVYYHKGAIFNENSGIYIERGEVLTFSGNIDDWFETNFGDKQGIVKKITTQRLFLDDGRAIQFMPGMKIQGVKEEAGEISFVDVDLASVQAGDRVGFGRLYMLETVFVEVTD